MSKRKKTAPVELEAPRTWHELNNRLPDTTEEDCVWLIEQELQGRNRPRFLDRLYGRYAKLRDDRERRALLRGEWEKR